MHRKDSRLYAVLGVLVLAAPLAAPLSAHHDGEEMATRSARCGWIETGSVRDRHSLTMFCAESVAGELRIRSAHANGERLSIEAPPDLVARLRGDDRSTSALLRRWLAEWRRISGYHTASISLLRNHREFAKVHTTMTGDVVIVR